MGILYLYGLSEVLIGWLIFMSIRVAQNGRRRLIWIFILEMIVPIVYIVMGGGFYSTYVLAFMLIINIIAWIRIRRTLGQSEDLAGRPLECPQCKKNNSMFLRRANLNQETGNWVPSKWAATLYLVGAILFFVVGVFLFTQGSIEGGVAGIVLGSASFATYRQGAKPSDPYIKYKCVDCGHKFQIKEPDYQDAE